MTFDPFCAPGGGGGGAAGVSEFALRMLAFLRRTGDSRIILGEKTARVEGVVVEGGVTEVLGVVFCSAGVVLGAGGGGGGGGRGRGRRCRGIRGDSRSWVRSGAWLSSVATTGRIVALKAGHGLEMEMTEKYSQLMLDRNVFKYG